MYKLTTVSIDYISAKVFSPEKRGTTHRSYILQITTFYDDNARMTTAVKGQKRPKNISVLHSEDRGRPSHYSHEVGLSPISFLNFPFLLANLSLLSSLYLTITSYHPHPIERTTAVP
jgi:hypothetical protein